MVSDAGAIQSKYRKDLEDWKIPYEENGHSLETFFEFTKVVKKTGTKKKQVNPHFILGQKQGTNN